MKCKVGKTDRPIRVIVGLAIWAAGADCHSWWGLVGLAPSGDGHLPVLPGLSAVRDFHLHALRQPQAAVA